MTTIIWIIYAAGNDLVIPMKISPQFESQEACQAELVRLVDEKAIVFGPGYTGICLPVAARDNFQGEK